MLINCKIFLLVILFKVLIAINSYSIASEENFESWLISYKEFALKEGISQSTLDKTFKKTKFLSQVIKYDRKQPEFYEDTITYVSKRANTLRANKAKKLFIKNSKLFNKVEKEFFVEKEILLALWGIETNFGKHIGKMDIISSLATLSYDKRRSKFFSSELLILLQLIDNNVIDLSKLYGSWAGAFGNFQFMPSTIKRYAIDYDNNNKIELKSSLQDSVASAANYINSVGWKYNEPCFYRVKLKNKVNKKYLNTSARKLKNKLKISEWEKKGIVSYNNTELNKDYKAALIYPDNNKNSPTYLVFNNYEKILKWNRSLRFGISVCTLAEMIKS